MPKSSLTLCGPIWRLRESELRGVGSCAKSLPRISACDTPQLQVRTTAVRKRWSAGKTQVTSIMVTTPGLGRVPNRIRYLEKDRLMIGREESQPRTADP